MDEEESGLFNPEWMLRKSLLHVPHRALYNAVLELITYLAHGDETMNAPEGLDILAQVALTGAYVAPVAPLVIDLEGTGWTEAEIQAFYDEMDESPTADDPMEDFTL